ncbi:hypothetical protein AGMMS4952_27550 [Spirochaetia bacterium]|nr:hypothetical protein AGMMS4952_27550 [Spirochaetia bacterium]
MKKQTLFILGIAVIALLFGLSGCPTDDDTPTTNGPAPFEGKPSGRDSGTFWGYSSDITVEITMEDGYITLVTITTSGGEGHESPGIGQVLVERAPDLIKTQNSIDAVSSATCTYTRDAIKTAGQQAIDKIKAAQP